MKTVKFLRGYLAALAVVANASCAPAPAVSPRATPALTPPPTSARSSSERLAESLSGTVLKTQEGRPVYLYDELMKGKIVLINFMFTSCSNLCPFSTANLALVQKELGQRVGRDIVMLSISVDPETDTPAALKKFAERFKVKDGWYFLTGKRTDVDRIRKRLGVYEPDLAKDSDKFEHTGLLTYGNEPSGRWQAIPVLSKASDIVDAVNRVAELRSLP